MVQEERTEEGKVALATALGAWTALCTASPAAVARFSHGLTKEKEVVKRAHLHALLHALQQPPTRKGGDQPNTTNATGAAASRAALLPTPNAATVAFLAPPLTPLLCKLVSEGLTKATARADGLAAALALGLAAGEGSVRGVLTTDEVQFVQFVGLHCTCIHPARAGVCTHLKQRTCVCVSTTP